MADVNRPRSERAQLILISGLMIAVTLLVLVLLLNTVIYTENVATRGIDSDIGDAAAFQTELLTEIDRIVETATVHGERDAEWETFEGNVTNGVDALVTFETARSLDRGHVATATYNVTAGANISEQLDHFDEQELVAGGVIRTVHFTVTVAEEDINDVPLNESLAIEANGVQYHLNRSTDGVAVETEAGVICDPVPISDTITIDFIDNVIDGQPCGQDLFGKDGAPAPGTPPYDIAVIPESTEPSSLSYHLAVGVEDPSTVEPTDWYVHEVMIDLTYVSPELRFSANHTIEGVHPS